MKNFLKKVSYYLQLFDGFWSLPLAFASFCIVGSLLAALGMASGTYDVGFIQPLFLSIAVLIGAANAALGFLYFFCRGIFKWFYGFKNSEGKRVVNAVDDWQNLTAVQKFALFFLVFFGIIGSIILVYVQFV